MFVVQTVKNGEVVTARFNKFENTFVWAREEIEENPKAIISIGMNVNGEFVLIHRLGVHV